MSDENSLVDSVEQMIAQALTSDPKNIQVKTKRRPPMDGKLEIINLVDEPTGVAENSNRARNMRVVMESRTVKEALDRLGELPSAGSSADIRLAVNKGVIRLAEPQQE